MDKWEKLCTRCFKELFRRVGEKFPNNELTKDPEWYMRRSWTEEEQEDFKKWIKREMKRTLPILRSAATSSTWRGKLLPLRSPGATVLKTVF